MIEWDQGDYAAIELLSAHGIKDYRRNGVLSPPTWPFEETEQISAAINYLCCEWDYAYGPRC